MKMHATFLSRAESGSAIYFPRALQTLTVTRRKVAGMEVLPSVLLFSACANSRSCLSICSIFPLF